MNYQQKDWLGSWQNFESYLVSTAPAMQAEMEIIIIV